MKSNNIDHNDYAEIAEGVYWVGSVDENAGFHCNPYLVVDHNEAVLLDGGSRNDFSTIMLKIMRTGTNPKNIIRLIYQHYDPDLCGNIPHMEALISSQELKIISHKENNIFINYYSSKSPKLCIEDMDFCFQFSSGRRLRFIRTPYSHAPGSFVTYDAKTKVLFSGDIFGSYGAHWDFYTKIGERCLSCLKKEALPPVCPSTRRNCQIFEVLDFHRRTMTSATALGYALDQIEKLDIAIIAPQHGSIFHTPAAREIIIGQLKSLPKVGFDYFLEVSGR